jgi:hypothetical protein
VDVVHVISPCAGVSPGGCLVSEGLEGFEAELC